MKKEDTVIKTPSTLLMAQLKELKMSCDAISACNVFGFDTDVEIRKLGGRAIKLFDQEIGEEIEQLKVLEAEIEDFNNEDDIKVKKYRSNERATLAKKTVFEFDPIVISATEPERRKWRESFPQTKVITFRGIRYGLEPYAVFHDMIEREFIIINKI